MFIRTPLPLQAMASSLDLLFAMPLGDVTPVVEEFPYMKDFRCQVGSKGMDFDCAGKTLLELLAHDQGKKCMATCVKVVCTPEFEPSSNQLRLVAIVGFLMEKLGLEVPTEVHALVERFTLHLKTWPDQTRLLYILEVKGAQVFKLGTFKINHAPRLMRTNVLRRYVKRDGALRNHPAFPKGVEVDWKLENLFFRKVVAVNASEFPDDPVSDDECLQPPAKKKKVKSPDEPIHEQLRKIATRRLLINTGSTEFHDRALLFKAEALLDQASQPSGLAVGDAEYSDVDGFESPTHLSHKLKASSSGSLKVATVDACTSTDVPMLVNAPVVNRRGKGRGKCTTGAVSLLPFLKRKA